MANKKISCPKCRRSYDNKIEYCPYCGTVNPLMDEDAKAEIEQEEALSEQKPQVKKSIPIKPVQKKAPTPPPKPEPEPEVDDEYDDSEYAEEYAEDEYDEGYDDGEIEYEGEESYEDEEDSEYDEDYEDEQYEGYDDEEDPSEEGYEDEEDEENMASELTEDEKRIPINWTDEKKKEKKDNSPAYYEYGKYQSNFDGYYNDTKAKIDNEIDNLAAGKEKAILKVVFGVVAVIGVIVYLILTL